MERHSSKKGINSLSHFFFKKNWKKKKFKSVSHKKIQILWFFQKEKQSLWVMVKWRVKFFESYFEKNWVILKKKKFSSLYRICEKSSILWFVLFLTKKLKNSILWLMLKKFQFFESFFFLKKKSILRVMLKKVQFIESYSKMGSIHWVVFKKEFDSLNHPQKEIHFFVSYTKKRFNSLSHIS